MERVLVVFQAVTAKTESLALAFGLGAVEGGALIRLRHLDAGVSSELEHSGYVSPKAADLEWAEVVGLALEAAAPGAALEQFMEQVDALRNGAGLQKTFYVFGGEAKMPSVAYAETMLKTFGAALVETESAAADADTARAVGRKVALQA